MMLRESFSLNFWRPAAKCLPGILSLALVAFSPSTARASAITVNNPSFEILPAGGLPFPYPGNGHYSEAPIPGWTNFQTPGVSGQYAPGAIPGAEYNYLPDGVTFAYSNGGTISQTVGATVVVGDVFTLSVDLGNRKDLAGGTGGIDLLVNGHKYAAPAVAIANGGWSVYTASYFGLAADAGDSITIELNNPVGSGGQANFDAVSLNEDLAPSDTPEPGTVLLMSTGFVSMLIMTRRGVAGRSR